MQLNKNVEVLKSNSLSKFRTFHHFEYYGEVSSLKDYINYIDWAKKNKKDIFILGNGSNTLFVKKKVETLVLKNKIPKEIKCISKENNLYEVSSSVMMNQLLNYCYKNSLDSFYFLASVPATIGGALAMNAGRGKNNNNTIFNFVESIKYLDSDNKVKEILKDKMDIKHRHTIFSGCQKKFIISVVFRFPSRDFGSSNPIKDRVMWAKKHQDNVAPNCGSIFSECNGRILRRLKGIKIGQAYYSSKTTNWINNYSQSSIPILILIFIAKLLHIMLFQKCKIEIIRVK